jgi:hypothetical protein
MKKYTLISIFLFSILFSFMIGILVGGFEYPPYSTIKSIYLETIPKKIETDDFSNLNINVSSLIHTQNYEDILNARIFLIDYIWNEDSFPYNKMPNKIEQNIFDKKFSDLTNLKQIDKIIISMEYEINSEAYIFLPTTSNNKLVIYHEGHGGSFVLGKNTIQYFLDNNYSVLALSMPLIEPNNQPTVKLKNFGNLILNSHDDLRFLESEKFSPIIFFVEPIAVSLNYLDKEYEFESYDMVGISGGGWTTVLYSALDTRISKSYPVASSIPMYLRFYTEKNIGDYEQTIPELYSKVGYLDLYIMASQGDDRGQLQIFNKYDPCCFSGLGFQTYEFEIKNIISKLEKGKFDIVLDEMNKKHSISNQSLKIILNDMKS